MKLRNKKTGEIVELECISLFEPEWQDSAQSFDEAYSIAELNENWEDALEPLIKDKKIRKAVRAWAEANDIGVVKLKQDKHRLVDRNVGIEFDTYLFEELQDGWNYSIAELCEEEE